MAFDIASEFGLHDFVTRGQRHRAWPRTLTAVEIIGRLGHVVRYLAGAAAAGAVFLAQSAILVVPYALVAALGYGIVGGILGLLFGFLIAFIVGLLVVTLIIFPAGLLAELFARRTHWAIVPLAMLVLLVAFTALATAIVQAFGGPADASFGLAFAATVLPAIAFGLVTYPAEWLTVGLISLIKRHAPRLISRLKPQPTEMQPTDIQPPTAP